ncbi:PD-(D/E)XK nuclease family protein [Campylobacter concisus]|uniref:PDDEXK-like family protein n=1 Tax=Campylobacter concisus TaxID=199 RepID=UPI0018846B72|nr:PD-(D/E)XK nuclease family protein [Campylobacter concisus]MBE9863964.1 PD-(D/E)XK nuclease family protein [Campylobacter concisus]
MWIKSKKEHFEKLFADMSKGYMAAKAEADRQRAMGKHDYNIFTLFHKFSDEVNLHSNFIASLLDPNGDHYKGGLFLKLFLETCGIDDFGIDTSIATVFKEFKHIDIYISDGKKHIILENKVYAKDQPTQIARYIKAIQNKDAEVKDEDICVLYLHPDGELPDKQSLGDYHARLLGENPSIKFKVISYSKEILEWIDRCKNEVSNITDLNVFLSQYKDVIEMIYDRYKRIDEMNNEDLIEIFKDNYRAVSDIVSNYEQTRRKIINDFFQNISDSLKDIYKEEKGFEISQPNNIITDYGKNCQPIKITQKRWELFDFAIEFMDKGLKKPIIGFVKNEKSKSIELKYITMDGKIIKDNYWIVYKDITRDDICKDIVKENFKKALLDDIKNFINEFNEKISNLNQN